MRRFGDPLVCPDCSARLPLGAQACPACGLGLSGPVASELLATLQNADRLLEQLRADSATLPEQAPVTLPPPRTRPERPERRGLSHLSVPKILLGLGALCLLVAAVIFLAVAWSWLGVGGRTAVLVGLTVLSGGLGVWFGRHGLRMAAEALTTVALGLLALDVVGADNAGWLGDLSTNGTVCVTGAVVTTAALTLTVLTRLGAPQLGAAFAGSAAGIGALGLTDHRQLVAAVAVLGYAVLVALGRRLSLPLLVVASALIATWWWLGLAVSGLQEAADHASLAGLWAHGHGLALLTAALMLLLPAGLARHHPQVVRAAAAASATALTVTAALPSVDETTTTVGVVAIAATLAWTAAAVLLPEAWRPVAQLPLLASAVPVVLITLGLAAEATVNATGREPFTTTVGFDLPDADPVAHPALLVVGAATLLAAVTSVLPRATEPAWLTGSAGGLALGGIGSLALLPVPAWTIVGALLLVGGALVALGVRRDDTLGVGAAIAGVLVSVGAITVALPSAALTTIATGVLVVEAIAIRWTGRFADAGTGGGLLLPVASAAFVWSGLTAADVDPVYRGVPVLVVVGLLALVMAVPDVEVAAALGGAAAAVVAVTSADDTATALAIHLTVAGALVTASALVHPTRRVLGWPGGGLLAAATWVRLADLGVEAPEAYTLPGAVALVAVGLDRLRRDPEASTTTALLPGLVLGTVPSLVWVLDDPASLRALLLGLACLALVLAGPALQWSAPLVVGAAVGAVLVVRELAPYAADVPQWALIGLAGTALTVVGVTWERRVRDVRRTTAYLGRLR
ncbi:SCO7613 C-terminal domain-containing membrane protein [Nocardioides sp.]|uniref:SCO7613 C-terminal domain-containing membrane protein n=1 Tax=Nocardioides sp. TaxID=35761 RepID=UPI002EDAEEBE